MAANLWSKCFCSYIIVIWIATTTVYANYNDTALRVRPPEHVLHYPYIEYFT